MFLRKSVMVVNTELKYETLQQAHSSMTPEYAQRRAKFTGEYKHKSKSHTR